MKKQFSKLILGSLLLMATPAAMAQWNPGEIVGTGQNEADAYQISTAAHLNTLATWVNVGASTSGKFYRLVADINVGNAWMPIGDDSQSNLNARFLGTFDGAGHTVTIGGIGNVVQSYQYTHYFIGLFGILGSGGVIKQPPPKEVDFVKN